MSLFITLKKVEDNFEDQNSNEQNFQNQNSQQHQQSFNQQMNYSQNQQMVNQNNQLIYNGMMQDDFSGQQNHDVQQPQQSFNQQMNYNPNQQMVNQNNQQIYNGIPQNNFAEQQNHNQYNSKPIKNIGSFILSISLSLIVFGIAIYIFVGPFIANIVLSLFPSLNESSYLYVVTEQFINQLTMFCICQSAIYGLLSTFASYFATKDAFRKKMLNITQVKSFKILSSIWYIIFFGVAMFFNYVSNAQLINQIKSGVSNSWLDSLSKSAVTLFESVPLISIGVIGLILIMALSINIKLINKKCV